MDERLIPHLGAPFIAFGHLATAKICKNVKKLINPLAVSWHTELRQRLPLLHQQQLPLHFRIQPPKVVSSNDRLHLATPKLFKSLSIYPNPQGRQVMFKSQDTSTLSLFLIPDITSRGSIPMQWLSNTDGSAVLLLLKL